jgi:hypothetical protein
MAQAPKLPAHLSAIENLLEECAQSDLALLMHTLLNGLNNNERAAVRNTWLDFNQVTK